MNILVFTNTFTPHVGGVARSVEDFTRIYRELGHRVLVAAPMFEGTPAREIDVVRIPAVQNFNGSDFSVPLPVPGGLAAAIGELEPDVVHSHHPFLLGDTALRVAAARAVPVVFTHHTMYEKYTHYVPGDSPRMRRFAIELATGYANLCDAVVAPSESVAEILRGRGVKTRIEVIPTGIDLAVFRRGDGREARRRLDIPFEAFVVGHVGRLAPEKNLGFLAAALATFARRTAGAIVLVSGEGPSGETIRQVFSEATLSDRLRLTGAFARASLVDAYHAMDVFAFASRTETQGMVLAEAMAAGVPVVAIDAPGAREVVRDGVNGRLLPAEDGEAFAGALEWIRERPAAERERLSAEVARTAEQFSIARTARRALALYEELIRKGASDRPVEGSLWAASRRRLREEWKIVKNIVTAAGDAWRTPLSEAERGHVPRSARGFGGHRRSTAKRAPDGAPESMDAADGPPGSMEPARVAPRAERRGPGASEQRRSQSDRAADGPPGSKTPRLLGWLLARALRLEARTWRCHLAGLERIDRLLAERRQVLMVFWHGKYVPLFTLLRIPGACAFTSRSFRGDVIGEICRQLGYRAIEIAEHGGRASLERMRDALRSAPAGGIAVDGPRGPYHAVKRGAAELASDLGLVILPVSVASRRKRILAGRWDRMEIPRLFTRVRLGVGEPIEVPRGLDTNGVDEWSGRVHDALDTLDEHLEAEVRNPDSRQGEYARRTYC